MRVEWGLAQETAQWVATRVPGCARGWAKCRAALVVDQAGKPAAGVVFHDWSPETGVIEVTAAADDPRWAQRGVLRELFDYAFGACGCQMVVARTGSERVKRLWRRFGATAYEIPRLGGRDRPLVLLTLTDDAWRASPLNGGPHGQA